MKITTRQMILNTAISTLGKKNYNSISMQELADACGITKPAIYYHFKNKKELFFTLFKEITSGFKQLICDELASDRSIRRSLKNIEDEVCRNSGNLSVITRAHIAFATDPELIALFPDILLLVREGLGLLEELFEKGIASNELRSDLDPSSAARLFSSVLHSIMIEETIIQDSISNNTASLFFELLYNGISSTTTESRNR